MMNNILLAVITIFLSESVPYTVSTSSGTVVVRTQGDWHINSNYPWKVTAQGKTYDFDISTTSATARGIPKGPATLKGGVCSEAQCLTIKQELTIP